MKRSVLALLAVLSAAGAAAEPRADLILRGGRVFLAPGRYAEAVAVEGGRIVAVGSEDALLRLKGSKTRVVDLRGRAVVPGFHDAHVHFTEAGLYFAQVDLTGCATVAEIQARLRQFISASSSSSWVIGHGWDQAAFPGKRFPSKADLDAVSSSLPIVLAHVDGPSHLLWANTPALRAAGIAKDIPDPPGGRIDRDESGEPTGLLFESAGKLMKAVMPAPDGKAIKSALRKALAAARQNGVTAIQGPVNVSIEEEFEAWRQLDKEGEATLRYFIWGRLDDLKEAGRIRSEFSRLSADKFRPRGLKVFLDGVIGGRTAALLKPYSDDPKTSAEPKYSRDRLEELVRAGLRADYQIVMHAVGDRAVRMGLDAYEAARSAASPSGAMMPCKIEHIELVDPADLPRFKELGVAASMQPSHMTYDNEEQNYNPERLGRRVRHAFAWRSLERAGAVLAFGTDWPTMPLDPRVNLFAATTREHFNGKPEGGWVPEEKVSLEDAVVHYTLDPARAIGRGSELGSIEAGKLADLVVFERDLFSVSGLDLLKIQVDMTIFDGKIVYERHAR